MTDSGSKRVENGAEVLSPSVQEMVDVVSTVGADGIVGSQGSGGRSDDLPSPHSGMQGNKAKTPGSNSLVLSDRVLVGEGPSSPPSLGQLNTAIEEPSTASPPCNPLGGRVKDSMEKKGRPNKSSQGVIKQASPPN